MIGLLNPYILLCAGLVVAATLGLRTFGSSREADGRAAVQAQWDAAKALQLESLRIAEKRERSTEQAGQAIVEAEVQHARQEDTRTATAAADLRSARQRVQQLAEELAATAARTCAASGAAGGSAATATPGLVLTDLYRGADAEAAELAEAFDQAHRRGLRCERISDEVRAAYNAAPAQAAP